MQVGKRDEIDIDFLERCKKAFNFALGNHPKIILKTIDMKKIFQFALLALLSIAPCYLLPYYYSKIKSK